MYNILSVGLGVKTFPITIKNILKTQFETHALLHPQNTEVEQSSMEHNLSTTVYVDM